MTRLNKESVVHTEPFNQGVPRLIADKNLLDLIVKKLIVHDGNPQLRTHIDNADKKVDQDRKLRIVKRTQSLKVDLAVALSMAASVQSGLHKPASSPAVGGARKEQRQFRVL
jgi:phage terminase large subunit-like protein